MFWLPPALYESLPYAYVIGSAFAMSGDSAFGQLMGFILLAMGVLIIYMRHTNRVKSN